MFAWRLDGLAIPDTCAFDADLQAVIGTAIFKNNAYKWWANAREGGWTVTVEDQRALRSVYQGTTFNLFLEVAAAVRRARGFHGALLQGLRGCPEPPVSAVSDLRDRR